MRTKMRARRYLLMKKRFKGTDISVKIWKHILRTEMKAIRKQRYGDKSSNTEDRTEV